VHCVISALSPAKLSRSTSLKRTRNASAHAQICHQKDTEKGRGRQRKYERQRNRQIRQIRQTDPHEFTFRTALLLLLLLLLTMGLASSAAQRSSTLRSRPFQGTVILCLRPTVVVPAVFCDQAASENDCRPSVISSMPLCLSAVRKREEVGPPQQRQQRVSE
jgi:hypothetical protein